MGRTVTIANSSTNFVFSQQGQQRHKLPEDPDFITGVKPELEKSAVRSERQGPPQVAIKMSPVCSHSESNHASRCLHGIIGSTPCMGTDTLSCEMHFVRFFTEFAREDTVFPDLERPFVKKAQSQ